MNNSALLIIDMQNDFCMGGSLAVNGSNEIIFVINDLIKKSQKLNFFILATKDWHPEHHISFEENKKQFEKKEFSEYLQYQEPYFWPRHCVAWTHGAEFVEGLDFKSIEKVFHKGSNILIDAYSAFTTNKNIISNYFLDTYLKQEKIKNIYICGLAMDFCVLNTALDAKKLGYNVILIRDATKAVFADKIADIEAEYLKNEIKIITKNEFLNM